MTLPSEASLEFLCGVGFGLGMSVLGFGLVKGLTYRFYARKGQEIDELHALASDCIISWRQADLQVHQLLLDPHRPFYVKLWNHLVSLTGGYPNANRDEVEQDVTRPDNYN
jgi:hypothetical protein